MNEQLKQKLIEQLGYDELNDECIQTLQDVNRGGANAGFGSFVYSANMLDFYKENKKLILEQLKEDAESFGIDMLYMIQCFNCLKDFKMDLSLSEIAAILYGEYDNEMASLVIDSACWACLEDLAREFDR